MPGSQTLPYMTKKCPFCQKQCYFKAFLCYFKAFLSKTSQRVPLFEDSGCYPEIIDYVLCAVTDFE